MKKERIQTGTVKADPSFHIAIKEQGPYLVFGNPPLAQQFIELNDQGECWSMREGRSFSTEKEPTALCRCGHSHNNPYCDGTHSKIEWDGELTASTDPLLADAEFIHGPDLILSDNEAYCVFARFCDARGRVWNLVRESENELARETAIREANMCPGGRLSAWNNRTEVPFEPHYDPSLGLIEDPSIEVSGGLWVRGGIAVKGYDGTDYEIRNRTVLCRCGASANKPFCDGTHAAAHYRDSIAEKPKE